MTQDSTRRSPSASRRAARTGRNKPMLVTSTENEDNEQVIEETDPTLEESMAEVQAQNPPVASKARAPRRLPGFFSTVGKQAQPQVTDTDAAQARIARATRSKETSAKATGATTAEIKSTSTSKPVAKQESARTGGTAGSARATQPARSGFKTKYLIGMGIYLVVAEFMGTFVVNFFRANGLDTVLTRFNLFGGEITISTSVLAFLAILIILLIVLARFDLIPRSFTAMSANPPQRRTSGNSNAKSSQNSTESSRTTPPSMRQGVKGANDDLYQEYRANQRKEKKR